MAGRKLSEEKEKQRGRRIAATRNQMAYSPLVDDISESGFGLVNKIYVLIPEDTMKSLEKWAAIYEKHDKQVTTTTLVARRFLHHAMRRYNLLLKSGDINPYSPDCRLPGSKSTD